MLKSQVHVRSESDPDYFSSQVLEQYLAYVDSRKLYNLTILWLKLRRIYKERIRVRNNIRKFKAKLY